jgi:chitinase
LIAIGGWSEGSTVFSAVVSDAVLRARFVNNVYSFVKTYGFNGLDLDWEYPAQRGGSSADKVNKNFEFLLLLQLCCKIEKKKKKNNTFILQANYVYLLRELRAKFSPEGLLLTAAVGMTSSYTSTSYSVRDLAA